MWQPFGRRFIQIELTPEQLEKIAPKHVGTKNGVAIYEELLESWLE